MKETLEEAAKKYWEANKYKSDYPHCPFSFQDGAKWQQETDRKYFHKYIKSEKDFQIEKMSKLGINTSGQCFEQMVTSLIIQQERSYTEEEIRKSLLDIVLVNPAHITILKSGYGEFPDTYELTEKGVDYIIEQFKKK